jgi:hypothetical protein
MGAKKSYNCSEFNIWSLRNSESASTSLLEAVSVENTKPHEIVAGWGSCRSCGFMNSCDGFQQSSTKGNNICKCGHHFSRHR